MRALLFAIGTRGDAEPFLALAEFLKSHDWEVICVFPEQFRSMVEQAGIPFYGFDKRFLELLEGETGKTIMGKSGSLLTRLKALRELSRSSWKLQDRLLETQERCINDLSPDIVFYHPKCVYPILWEIAKPGGTIMVSPIPCVVHEVKEYTTIGLAGNGNYGPFLNRLSYKVVNWIRALFFYRFSKKYSKHLHAGKIRARDIYRTLVYNTKTFYSISTSLFPRPEYWPDNLYVTGFIERDRTITWRPSHQVVDFLNRFEKVLLITFGSMKNQHPEQKTRAFIEVLKRHRIPAVINISWGGLMEIEDPPDHVHFVQNIPYDWILPKSYAIVHHGGSGTTHTACKYGCPSLIIPHIVDQYFWNRRIFELGLGPRGISIKKLSVATVEDLLVDLWSNTSYKKRAKQVQAEMSAEEATRDLMKMINDPV